MFDRIRLHNGCSNNEGSAVRASNTDLYHTKRLCKIIGNERYCIEDTKRYELPLMFCWTFTNLYLCLRQVVRFLFVNRII